MALSCEVNESRSFHEQLLNAVGQAVIASNLDGKINYWNKAAEHMYGWSADEVLGRDIFEITASLDDRRHMIGEPGAGGSFSDEFLVQRRDGTRFPAHVTTSPIVDSEGAIIGVVGIHSDITVQKQTAETLREREKLFRVVVESAPNGIMIVNPEGRIDLVNTEVERTFGYLRDDLIGMPVEKLVPLSARKAHANLRSSFVMEHQKRRLGMGRDLSALRADGSTFPAEIGLTPIETPQGMKVLATVVDITARRRTEVALRESEARLRLALTAAHMGLWDWCISKDVLTWSDETYEIFGVDPAMFQSNYEAFMELIHPDDRRQVDLLTQWAVETGNDVEIEHRIVLPDGGVRWVSSRGRAVQDDDGTRLVGIVMDTTERKRHEEAVHSSEARYRAITENVKDVVMRHDANGTLLYASKSCIKLFGYDPAEMVAIGLPAIIDSADVESVDAEFRKMKQGEPMNAVFRISTKSGETVWVEMSGSPLLDNAGRLKEIFSVARDVSERMRYEQELIEAKEKAEEMARLKDTLLTNMSHEIRTPLTAIIGFSAILRSESVEKVCSMAQLIQSSGERLMMTLESVLDLAGLESNSIRLSPVETDLVRQIEDVLCLFRRQAEDKGLYVKFTHSEPKMIATLDQGAFSRVLTNLLANTVKFTKTGGMTIGLDRVDRNAVLRLTDTGIGMSDGFKAHLFREFKQESEGLSRSFEGVGLGLAIAKRLTELMNGTIEVESEKGKGTTFTITLPLVQPHIHMNGKSGDLNPSI